MHRDHVGDDCAVRAGIGDLRNGAGRGAVFALISSILALDTHRSCAGVAAVDEGENLDRRRAGKERTSVDGKGRLDCESRAQKREAQETS